MALLTFLKAEGQTFSLKTPPIWLNAMRSLHMPPGDWAEHLMTVTRRILTGFEPCSRSGYVGEAKRERRCAEALLEECPGGRLLPAWPEG